MAISQTIEIRNQAVELSEKSFGAFCNDISGMFGVKMQYICQDVCYQNLDALKADFSKLVTVFAVKSEGALDGTFQLIFDQGGLFTLAGLITMPEQMSSLAEKYLRAEKILKNIKSGSLQDAESMRDVLAEAEADKAKAEAEKVRAEVEKARAELEKAEVAASTKPSAGTQNG